MSTRSRAIDKLPTPSPSQSKNLKVIVVGGCRTGTTSLGKTCELLGYSTAVGAAHGFFVEHVYPYWIEAIDAKYNGKGEPYSAEDFDKFLGKYEALTGWWGSLLADELIEAFPEAKVIFTIREPDAYVESFNDTVCWVQAMWDRWWWVLPFVGPGSRIKEFVHVKNLAFQAWSYGDPWNRLEQKKFLLDYNQHIRELVPKERLLEFSAKEGWQPLCKFPDKKIPDVPIPRGNNKQEFRVVMNRIWWNTVAQALANVSAGALLGVLLYRAWEGKPLLSDVISRSVLRR